MSAGIELGRPRVRKPRNRNFSQTFWRLIGLLFSRIKQVIRNFEERVEDKDVIKSYTNVVAKEPD
jgi:hypothetical protein